jgi:hypothetical protein
MHEFGSAVTVQELSWVWGEYKNPSILEYHLRSLVKLGVVEIVGGPDLRFGLVDETEAANQVLDGLAARSEVARGNGMQESIPAFNNDRGGISEGA